MQTISYSFYKSAKKMNDITVKPEAIKFSDTLSGYGYHLEQESDCIILFFGGSNYIAYNSVGKYAGQFECPFISVDYYGTQESKGKMNIKSMQQSATDLYDWAVERYANKKIIVMGHSYGTGMATYLASSRSCDTLILLSAYRDLADLYNKIIPIFWGPLKVFISNDIQAKDYAKKVQCPTYVIGSKADHTLDSALQEKVAECFSDAELKIFEDIDHENYLLNNNVIEYIEEIL
ncbi:MAG: alpha/beta fold hydrolase [Cellulosilyticum sp.]|nr:alpha/beta fold hydrolase [Cellulosilyticum sp.]